MTGLLEFWGHLCRRVFVRLDATFAASVDRLGVNLQRLWVVQALARGDCSDVDAFFSAHAQRLRARGAQAGCSDASALDLDWAPWLALRYVEVPNGRSLLGVEVMQRGGEHCSPCYCACDFHRCVLPGVLVTALPRIRRATRNLGGTLPPSPLLAWRFGVGVAGCWATG